MSAPIAAALSHCNAIVWAVIHHENFMSVVTESVHQLLQHCHTEMLQYVQLYSMRALGML
jgi:hypothetical protein